MALFSRKKVVKVDVVSGLAWSLHGVIWLGALLAYWNDLALGIMAISFVMAIRRFQKR